MQKLLEGRKFEEDDDAGDQKALWWAFVFVRIVKGSEGYIHVGVQHRMQAREDDEKEPDWFLERCLLINHTRRCVLIGQIAFAEIGERHLFVSR